MKKMTRVLTLVLALALCFSCMAVSVFADDPVACGSGCTCASGGKVCYSCAYNAGMSSEDRAAGLKDGTIVNCDGNCTFCYPPCPPSAPAAKAKPFVPDVSGKYRTSMNKIYASVTTASIYEAMEEEALVIDPATNTVVNMYDSEGNLIPCTLSSDGHFIIVPTNEGYAYVPTGK